MNGIIGATGLLMDGDLDDEDAHYVEIIRQSGEHLLQLINNILDFSRLDASCIELEEVAVRSAHDGSERGRYGRHGGARQENQARRQDQRERAQASHRRSRPPPAGVAQPARQRRQVHRAGRGTPRRVAHRERGGDGAVGDVGQRYRYRDSERRAATPVPRVQPGRWIDLAPVRRQRAWACDQPAPGRANGRLDDGGEHTQRRQHVRLQHPAA